MNENLRLAAIMADDFTSATDCGVQFATRGADTVALMAGAENTRALEYPVVAIDTDSRICRPDEAYARVFQAAKILNANGYRRIYKSIDSTVRGNLGAEIDAAMDAFAAEFALVAPAFPHYGRKTIQGIHYLNGVLITESIIAKDPIWPSQEADLCKLLAQQSKRKAGNLGLDMLRSNEADIPAFVEKRKADGVTLFVCDAEEENDLRLIAPFPRSSAPNTSSPAPPASRNTCRKRGALAETGGPSTTVTQAQSRWF